MFENIYGEIEEEHDIDGWVVVTSFGKHAYLGNSTYLGGFLYKHRICGGRPRYFGSSSDRRFYCKKCEIYMPRETQNVVLSQIISHSRHLPIP